MVCYVEAEINLYIISGRGYLILNVVTKNVLWQEGVIQRYRVHERFQIGIIFLWFVVMSPKIPW